MTRTTLDAVIAAVVAGVLVLGVGATWQTYRQMQAHGEMMGHTVTHGLHPLWYLFGSLLVAGAVAGIYWLVRSHVTATNHVAVSDQANVNDGVTTSERTVDPRAPETASPASVEPDSESPTPANPGAEPPSATGGESTARPTPRILDVLPEDERRILEPVVDSPGLTQIALRDRADFSKSKISQTVTDLEKRGLLYREPQGRTYRIYPSDDLEERHRAEHG